MLCNTVWALLDPPLLLELGVGRGYRYRLKRALDAAGIASGIPSV